VFDELAAERNIAYTTLMSTARWIEHTSQRADCVGTLRRPRAVS
jgi:hypothetical protein